MYSIVAGGFSIIFRIFSVYFSVMINKNLEKLKYENKKAINKKKRLSKIKKGKNKLYRRQRSGNLWKYNKSRGKIAM